MKRKSDDDELPLKKYRICRFEDCATKSCYGHVGERATRCVKHATADMVNVVSKRCQHEGCDTRPSYAKPGQQPAFCKEHAQTDMVNVVSQRCQQEGCDTRSNYAMPGQQAAFCAKHATADMVDVCHKRCQQEGCDTIPTYAKPGQKAAFCKEHAQIDMVDVVSKRCQQEGCDKIPSYAMPGQKAAFCKDHVTTDMINVHSKRCQQEGCDTIPAYAKPGQKAAFCKEHAQTDMVDVINKRCEQKCCDKIPSYAMPGQKAAFCKEHAQTDMVDVLHKRCQHEGCDKIPSYAKPGQKAAFCAKHAAADMVDVLHKRCQQEGCNTTANYGFLTFPAEFCAQHCDKANMVFKPTARCIAKACKNTATHGSASKRQHCEDHAQPGEIGFTKQLCLGPNGTGCGEMAVLSPTSQLCVGCDPKFKLVKPVKSKELAVRGALIEAGFTHFVYDRALPDNCGILSRPDFLFETPTHFVVIEVDEKQHKHLYCAGECTCSERLCNCEFTRMREIAFVLGLPTLFLRFNPDSYKTKGKTKSKSERHDHLIRVLRQSLQEKPINQCEVKYLFYDEKIVAHQIVSK